MTAQPASASVVQSSARSTLHAAPSRSTAAHETNVAEPSFTQSTAPQAHASATPTACVQESKQPSSATPASHNQDSTSTEQTESEGSFVAQAVSSFEPTGSNMVPVQAGDLIQVLEEHKSGWTYAKNLNLKVPSNTGWVPSWIVPARGATDPVSQPKPKPAEPQTTGVQQVQTGFSHTVQQAAPVVQQAPAMQQVQPAVAVAAATTTENRTVVRANDAFVGTSPSQLTLAPADLVEIVERHTSGWTYGRKVTDGSAVEGWFPDWVVCQQK